MEKILEILEGTPWYVYLIFFYVIYTGLKSFRPRTVSFWVILILPALLMLWSVSIVYSNWDRSVLSLFTWMGSILVGSVVGWWILRFYRYRVDHSKGTISLPVNKWMIVLLLGIFAVRYFFGYSYSTLEIVPKYFILIDFAISGFLIGIFVGRALHYWYIYTRRS